MKMAATMLLMLVGLLAGINSANALNCHKRNGNANTDAGNSQGCSTEATCYSHSSGGLSYAGCGSCSSRVSDCQTCSTSDCNNEVNSTTCYHALGTLYYNLRTSTTCYGTYKCYQYRVSFLFVNYFYAGCGECTDVLSSMGCSDCSSANCNSAAVLGVSTVVMATAALIATIVGSF